MKRGGRNQPACPQACPSNISQRRRDPGYRKKRRKLCYAKPESIPKPIINGKEKSETGRRRTMSSVPLPLRAIPPQSVLNLLQLPVHLVHPRHHTLQNGEVHRTLLGPSFTRLRPREILQTPPLLIQLLPERSILRELGVEPFPEFVIRVRRVDRERRWWRRGGRSLG